MDNYSIKKDFPIPVIPDNVTIMFYFIPFIADY